MITGEMLGTGTMTMRLRDTTWASRTMVKISTRQSHTFKGTLRHLRDFKKRSKKKSRVLGILNSRIIGAT